MTSSGGGSTIFAVALAPYAPPLASIPAIVVLAVSLCAISALTAVVSALIWAPRRSSTTCTATIPSSATATIAIHARPRIRRSSQGWSISASQRGDATTGCALAARG